MAGKIIVIEGTDCSGKETQSRLLEKRLNDEGIKCIRFGFPMYESPTGKIVGGAYLGKPEISEGLFPEGAPNVDPLVACLYYAADRKYNEVKNTNYNVSDIDISQSKVIFFSPYYNKYQIYSCMQI